MDGFIIGGGGLLSLLVGEWERGVTYLVVVVVEYMVGHDN